MAIFQANDDDGLTQQEAMERREEQSELAISRRQRRWISQSTGCWAGGEQCAEGFLGFGLSTWKNGVPSRDRGKTEGAGLGSRGKVRGQFCCQLI